MTVDKLMRMTVVDKLMRMTVVDKLMRMAVDKCVRWLID